VITFQMPFFQEPMETDEGVYFTVADSGALPYVRAFDHKPPLIHFWYRLALLFNSGVPSATVVHVMAAFLLALTVPAVYGVGRLLKDHCFGVSSALAFSALTSNQYLQLNASTEAFALLPLTLSLLAFLVGWKK
jgi:hypothetical protein